MARLSKKQDDNWFIKFDPKAWLTDAQLQMCSASARGVWINILMLMHDQNPRGVLTSNLSRLCKLLPDKREVIEEALRELHREGALSLGAEVDPRLPEKALVCRRMFRENRVSLDRSEAGRKGAEARWQKWQGHGKVVANPMANDHGKPMANAESVSANNDGGESAISGGVSDSKSMANGMANARQSSGLIVRSKKLELDPPKIDLRSRNARAPESGNAVPASVAQIFGEFQSDHFLENLLERIFAVARDGPAWRGWWCQALECIREHGELVSELEGALSYAEDCACPVTRQRKDLGELKQPGSYLAGKLMFSARREKVVLPPIPKSGA